MFGFLPTFPSFTGRRTASARTCGDSRTRHQRHCFQPWNIFHFQTNFMWFQLRFFGSDFYSDSNSRNKWNHNFTSGHWRAISCNLEQPFWGKLYYNQEGLILPDHPFRVEIQISHGRLKSLVTFDETLGSLGPPQKSHQELRYNTYKLLSDLKKSESLVPYFLIPDYLGGST